MSKNNRYTNHLATHADKLATKGKGLPTHLAVKFSEMQKYTHLVRKALQQELPMVNLDNCFVVDVQAKHITISVDSTTLANHLRYMSGQHLHNLKHLSHLFNNIEELKFITTYHRTIS